jgi:prepilin-type N-terminal cleavage/methylation domain-containing protein
MKGRPHRRAGFTLVEVLASLALVAAIIPAAMAGVSLAMGLGNTARQRTEAATLAHGRLAESLAAEDWRDGDSSGDFGDDWPDYGWELTVEDWDEAGLSAVSVSVTWFSRGTEQAVTATTLAYAGSE